MKKKYYLCLFLGILVLMSIACKIDATPTPNSVTPTFTFTPICTPTSQIVTPTPKIGTVNVSIGLNLREYPTENSKSLHLLKNGDKLKILGVESNGWLCVNFSYEGEDGKINTILGYVNPKFVDW